MNPWESVYQQGTDAPTTRLLAWPAFNVLSMIDANTLDCRAESKLWHVCAALHSLPIGKGDRLPRYTVRVLRFGVIQGG
jgi:hypothetical protein